MRRYIVMEVDSSDVGIVDGSVLERYEECSRERNANSDRGNICGTFLILEAGDKSRPSFFV